MIKKLLIFMGFSDSKKPTTHFSEFFHEASSAKKKKLLESVVREANKDQRDLVKKYKMTNPA